MPKVKIPTPLRQYTEGNTEVADGDEISIIPSIAGGRCR